MCSPGAGVAFRAPPGRVPGPQSGSTVDALRQRQRNKSVSLIDSYLQNAKTFMVLAIKR